MWVACALLQELKQQNAVAMAARSVPTPVRADGTAGPDDDTLPAHIATRILGGGGPP